MSAYLHAITTAVPAHQYRQEEICRWMQELTADDRRRRLLSVLYRSSGIEQRHTVIPEFGRGFFGRDAHGGLIKPGTGARNAVYARESRPLGRAAGEALFRARPEIAPATITHVVTASCTGFVNPGLDYFLVRDLGLPAGVERYHLGFMGCYAAFPALRMAARFCAAEPQARVLVLCLELCSLHLQLGEREDQLLANALFADGAAAALVSAAPPAPGDTALRLDRFASTLVPAGEAAMAWSIGDRGFDIALSSYVPKLLGGNIKAVVDDLFPGDDATAAVDSWAVHPGGKAILDQVERALALDSGQLAPSRRILRDFGNMSSATSLFVLHELLEQPDSRQGGRICSMAFGPGLTVELALLTKVHGTP